MLSAYKILVQQTRRRDTLFRLTERGVTEKPAVTFADAHFWHGD